MIARRLRMNNASKSSFVRLAQYLLNTQGNSQRVLSASVTNCCVNDPEWAAIEVEATQRQNVRAKGDKTYHLVVSFRDEPSPNIIKEIENRLCADLGFEEHQRISVLHGDSDNVHLHIAINKIHPNKLTIHEPYYDHKTLAKACVQLEHTYFIAQDNHEFRTTARPTAAQNMEAAGDIESLTGWIQRECGKQLKDASSWEELHSILAAHNLKLKPRGNGFIISSGKLNVKASSVDRSLSKSQLEKRLGIFVPSRAEHPARKKYVPRPMQHGFSTSRLWSQYKDACKQADTLRAEHMATLQKQISKEFELLPKGELQYAITKHFVEGAIWRRSLYALQRAERRRRLKALEKKFTSQKATIYAQTKRPTWRDWLTEEAKNGNTEALKAIQARGVKQRKNQIHIVSDSHSTYPIKVTHHGTRLFADGCRELNNSFQLPDHPQDSQILAVLRRVAGGGVRLSGSPNFISKILSLANTHKLHINFLQPELQKMWRAIDAPITASKHTRGRS